MQDCIFCKIVKGEIPSAKLYEDDDILSFLDIGPVNKGHALVLPKQHYETLLDIPDELLAKVAKATKNIASAIKQATNADGFNILQNNFKASGQLVPHLHNHIIPRLNNDGLKHWPQGKYKDKEIDEIKEKIVSSLD